MDRERRWDPCIAHHAERAEAFIADYFAGTARNTLLVAGAGFDPRSTALVSRLVLAQAKVRAILIQENRPKPTKDLVGRASANAADLAIAVPDHQFIPVDIFGTDGAVIGGRNAVGILARQNFEDITDIIVDISALSVGTAFPIIRYLVERCERGLAPVNLHLFVAHNPSLDFSIRSIAGDAPSYVHGFRGGSTLDQSAGAAKLWLPQLASGRGGALVRLHSFVDPHDTCPILPFPATDARLGDRLAEEFLAELESGWSVDTRNIVYADEADPLDLYRTILRLDDLRQPVFREVGGSLLVLSPLGSKVMALGALMAALERDLPVAYLESIGYSLDLSTPNACAAPDIVHIWLEGDVYPTPRPKILNKGTVTS